MDTETRINLKGAIAIGALAAAFGLVGNLDYAHELELEAAEKVARPERERERDAFLSAGACSTALVHCFRGATISSGDLSTRCFPIRITGDRERQADGVLTVSYY